MVRRAHDPLRRDPRAAPVDSPVQATQRVALEPMEVGGLSIPMGRQMTVLLGAANRDPRVHPDPDVLDLTRSPCRPLSFGFGIHHCIGATLAHVETEIALGMLADRFPRVPAGRPRPCRLATINRLPRHRELPDRLADKAEAPRSGGSCSESRPRAGL